MSHDEGRAVDENCLFCKIAAHEVDAEIIQEREDVLAIRDINPQAPVHVLVIPRQHITSASELTGEHGRLLAQLFEVLAAIASDESLSTGHRIVTNVGDDAGQSVDHLHFHLLGGRSLSWPPG
jgi:histidine triad (HIT) family protein